MPFPFETLQNVEPGWTPLLVWLAVLLLFSLTWASPCDVGKRCWRCCCCWYCCGLGRFSFDAAPRACAAAVADVFGTIASCVVAAAVGAGVTGGEPIYRPGGGGTRARSAFC